MNRLAATGAAVLSTVVLLGCAKPRPPMYLWESFPRQQYVTLQRTSPSADEQILELQAHAEKARATNAALPPGFRAHLGMLLLGAGKVDEARAMWLEEKLAFPESTAYMDQLLKRLDAPARTEVPA